MAIFAMVNLLWCRGRYGEHQIGLWRFIERFESVRVKICRYSTTISIRKTKCSFKKTHKLCEKGNFISKPHTNRCICTMQLCMDIPPHCYLKCSFFTRCYYPNIKEKWGGLNVLQFPNIETKKKLF